VNLAARLCTEAGPGQTLISASSQQALAASPEFVITALAPVMVKGKSEPVAVFQVSVPADHPAPAEHIVPTGT
jgi:class 3 adenylate cyclase